MIFHLKLRVFQWRPYRGGSLLRKHDKTIDKAGADFKQDFTYETYRAFFKGAGYRKVRTKLIDGRVPCAIAVITKEK